MSTKQFVRPKCLSTKGVYTRKACNPNSNNSNNSNNNVSGSSLKANRRSSKNKGHMRILRKSMKQYNKIKNGQNFQIGDKVYYTPEGYNNVPINTRPHNIGTVIGMNSNYIHFKPNYWNKSGSRK
jgi:hypothetical protein